MDDKIGNAAALEAGRNPQKKEEFLRDSRNYILRITSRIANTSVTVSDEEWSIALLAVSYALDHYDESKGAFWPYAGLIIKSRLTDWYRSNAKARAEISVRPEVFGGEVYDDDPDFSLQKEVRDHIGTTTENTLREEIEALQDELRDYGISFFDLAEASPKAEKTKKSCASLIVSLFAPPPPLTPKMRKSKTLPIKEMLGRVKISKKIIDRYRKYLITSALILDGDYPELADYLGYVREIIKEGGQYS